MFPPRSPLSGRRPRFRQFPAGAALLGLLASAFVVLTADPGSAAPRTGGPAPKVPSTGLLFGSTEPGDDSTSTMAAMESRIGRPLATSRVYSLWDDPQPAGAVTSNLKTGRLPLLSIRPQMRNGTKITWASIAKGARDADIKRQGDQLRAIGQPILLAFHHEANLFTGYGTAADFKAAFRHWVTVIRGRGATNVAFTMILTPGAFAHADKWYPGNSYVDWIGTDAYNFASCTSHVPAWHSLEHVAHDFYTWGSKTGKPLVLAEWGIARYPSNPAARAGWMADAHRTLAKWGNIKAAIYFDQVGSCDWRLATSASTLAAFTNLAHSSMANARPSASLVPAKAIAPSPMTATFNLAGSTGGHSHTGQGVKHWELYFGDGTSRHGTGTPGKVTHKYRAGTWQASLSITDTGNRTATTTTTVVSAAPPTVNQGFPKVKTKRTTTVRAWIQTNMLTGSYYIEWGTTKSYGHRTKSTALPAKPYQQSVTQVLPNLSPGVLYHWRATATTAAGTRKGVDSTFRQ